MSTFYVGTRLEALAGKLAANLDLEARHGDPFQPAVILVPNRNLRQWLQLRLAAVLGVAMNLRFDYLETGLWDLLRALDPAPASGRRKSAAEPPPELLSQEALQLAVLSVLLDDTAQREELRPLRAYLSDASGGAGQNYQRKVWQLAELLAGHFREYEYHRQEMLERWRAAGSDVAANARRKKALAATSLPVARMNAMEACQAALWREVRETLARAPGPRRYTLSQYASEVLRRIKSIASDSPRSSVHIFGIFQISPFHTQLLNALGARLAVNIYHLNVLAAPLEASGISDETRRQRFPALARREEGANELAALWGAAARESVFLWSKLLHPGGAFTFEALAPSPSTTDAAPPRTVLERLQDALRGKSPPNGGEQDQSVQVLSCPGIYREVESVYNSIIHNLQGDPSLKATEIAVLVTEMGKYRPVIQSVFGRKPRVVPYNLTDFSAAEESIFGQGLIALLDLALGNFARSQVFQVVMNPCFLSAAGVDRSQALVWRNWAEQLNIYHSFDSAEKAARGYPGNARFTWQQGMQRLRLGRIMDLAAAPGVAGGPAAYKDVAPFADIESGDRELLSAFCERIELLQRRMRELRELNADGAAWRGKIGSLLFDFLGVPEDRPEEEQVRHGILQALGALPLYDQLVEARGGKGGVVRASASTGNTGGNIAANGTLKLPLIREYLRHALAGLESHIGAYLTGGVTISALQPMRPIPFKIVYLLGLGEGGFPGSELHSSLDLRVLEQRRGDISLPETNQYLFLETLLSTQRKLYLSYVSQDVEKMQKLYPGSVLTILLRHLRQFAGGGWKSIEVPLKSSDARYLDQNEQNAHCDVMVNYSANDRLLALLDPTHASILNLTPAQEAAVQERALRYEFKALATTGGAGTESLPVARENERITTRELKAFLRNPAEGAVKRHLRLRDEDDEVKEDDEPFFTDDNRLLAAALREFVIAEMQGRAESRRPVWLEQFERVYAACRLQGATPDGAFEKVDRERLKSALEQRIAPLAAFVRERKKIDFYEEIIVGDSVKASASGLPFPALALPLAGGAKARLVGTLPLVWRGPESIEALTITTSAAPKTKLTHWILEPLLLYLAARGQSLRETTATIGDWLKGRRLRLHIAATDKIIPFTFNPSTAEAEAYVRSVVQDYLERGSFDLIPFELVIKHAALQRAYLDAKHDEDASAGYSKLLKELIEEDQDSPHPAYRAMRLLNLVDAKIPSDAYEKVRRRYQLLASGVEGASDEAREP